MDYKLELVTLPVSDVDRAKSFYVDQLGFNADYDHRVSPELRFVQLTPPGSGCSIAIGKGVLRHEQGPIRTLQVVVQDIEPAHAYLVAAGVAVSEVEDQPWGSFCYFDDPDGNSWSVQAIQPRS